jgi:hypothetical protein
LAGTTITQSVSPYNGSPMLTGFTDTTQISNGAPRGFRNSDRGGDLVVYVHHLYNEHDLALDELRLPARHEEAAIARCCRRLVRDTVRAAAQ